MADDRIPITRDGYEKLKGELVHLSGVKMIADLPGADLRGANFDGATLGVNIKNQGMGQMRTDLSGANLACASFVGADLRHATLDSSSFKLGDFPHAEDAGARTVTLPLFPAMQDADVDRVCAATSEVLRKLKT